jgi:ribose-phosphate pyrophosphokinase
MNNDNIKVFAINSTKEFGLKVSKYIGVHLSLHEEKTFEDGESYISSLENVRGKDVFVIHSLYGDTTESINDKLMRMLIFIGSLKDANAGRITSVLPIFPYARQDRKTSSRAPITTKYLANLFEAVGTNRILTMDAHNPTAIQNAFKINVDLLECAGLFANHIATEIEIGKFNYKNTLSVMSDVGGMTRVRRFRKLLAKRMRIDENDIDIACIDKLHKNTGEITAERVVGNVKGKHVIVLDDMISSGRTIWECAEASQKAGAISLSVCATHGLHVGKANTYLDHSFISRVVVADTVLPFRITNVRIKEKLTILNTSKLFAQAIMRTHHEESISDLVENGVHAI